MIWLKEKSKIVIEHLFNDVEKKIYDSIVKSNLKSDVKAFLTKNKINEIITSKPDKLFQIHEEFYATSFSNYSWSEYKSFIKAKNLKKLTTNQKKLLQKYGPTNKKLSIVFSYNKYISENKKKSYDISKEIGLNSCPYCNRNYTFTVVHVDKKTRKVNNSTRIVRPEFDHWFAKSDFPLFALSFYNLIPSCHSCNSSVKGSTTFELTTHIHPYVQEADEEFTFSYEKEGLSKNQIIIKYRGEKYKRTFEDMKMEEVYRSHSDHELHDLLLLSNKNPPNHIRSLQAAFVNCNIDLNNTEVYRLLFGAEIDAVNHHKRPLSKFKHDILKELGIIK